MKILFVLSALLLVACVVAVDEETYSTENDDFDINSVVADLDALKNLNGCFLGTATCTEVTSDFKKDIAEAVNTACKKCTQAQKQLFKVFLEALKDKLPKEYEAFKAKFDPQGTNFAALEAAVAKP